MPGEIIAEGQVRISADTAAAEAGLKKLESDFQRQMNAMDRASAEAKLSIDKTNVDRAIAETRADLDKFKAAKATATLEVDKAQAVKDIAETEALLKALGKQKTKLNIDSSDLRNANKEAAIAEKRQSAMAQQFLKTESAQRKLTASREKESTQILRNNSDLAKLREGYAKTRGEIEILEKKTGRPGGIFHTDSERRHLDTLRSDLALTEHKIRQLGGSFDDINPSLEKNQHTFGRWLGSLSSVRIQAGFFSATLRQFAVGFIALGPVITSLLGSAASLIGVLGTGLAGAAAVGAAGLAGFGLSALGVGLVMKPVISDIKSAMAASKAYHDAVLKYGKGSEQAKSAQEKLNMTLKGVSPTAREAIKGLGQMKDQWKQITAPARKNIFDAFGQSIKTAGALLPSFARQTNATTRVATEGWDKWMKALRSQGAKQGINDIMSNFRQSLPGIFSGLQSIGTALGNISVSASKMLPGLTRGFAQWGKNLMGAVGSGAALDAKIARLVGHMQDLGHLAQASGRLLTNFFNLSADSGDNLVQTLTRVFNRWSDWMNTAGGKDSMKTFFAEAADETKNLFAALGNLTQLLFQLGRATAPISAGMVKILKVIGDIVSAAADLPGVGTALKIIGGGLAALFIVGKARAFASAIGDAAMALKGLFAVEGVGGGLSALLGLGGATASTARFEAMLGGATAAEAGLATESGLLATLLAPEVLIPAGLIAGLGILALSINGTKTRFEEAGEAVNKTTGEMNHAVQKFVTDGSSYNSVLHEQAHSTDTVTAARHRLIKLQKEGASEHEQTKAVEELTAAEEQQQKVVYRAAKARGQSVKDAKAALDTPRARVKATKEELALDPHNAPHAFAGSAAEAAEKNAKAQRDYAAALQAAGQAAREFVVANIPLERQQKGLKPITEQAQQALTKLSETIGAGATKKIGNLVDPKQVQQIANLGNHLTKLGQGSTVKNIAVKSQGADETLNKLRAVNKASTRITGQTARLNVKTNDQGAQQKLVGLSRLAQKVTGARNTIHILANAANAEQAIARLRSHLEQVAHKKYEATVNAVDRTQPGWQSAYHHLREVASKKYEARINAIDNASAPAGKAKSAADKVKGTYQAHISAPGANEAAGQIQNVVNALSQIHDASATVTTHYVTTGHPPGRASGGPSEYTINRAAEQAATEPAGRSRRVNRPTMLTGEERGHPEYVIATNPAYRDSNERYLSDAAHHLGYQLIPSYAKGKGGGKKKPAAGGGGGGGATPAPPYKHQHKPHYTRKRRKFLSQPGANAVGELNATEQQLQNIEREFNAELEREEQEISHHKISAYKFGILRGFLDREASKEQHIRTDLIPAIRSASNNAIGHANKFLSTSLSAKEVKNAQKSANHIASEASRMHSPTKGKGESDKDYKAHKEAYEHHKAKKEREAQAAKKYAKRLAEERAAAIQIRTEAKEQLAEIRQEVVSEHETKAKEIETSQTNYAEMEANPEFTPYYESGTGAGSGNKPTAGEETATLSAAREALFNEYGSNISGFGGAAPTGGSASAGTGGPGSTTASFGYMPGGSSPTTNAFSAGSGGQDGGSGGTVNNVTNNFAAPPPDPHVWVQTQQFELGALS